MMKKLALMMGMVALGLCSQAQDTRVFTYEGTVYDKNTEEPMEYYGVDVYKGNEIIHSTTSGKKGRFEIELFANSTYTVEIFQDGYYPKRVVIHTQVPADIKKLGDLEFEVEMLRKSDYEDLEMVDVFATSIFDFPYVIFEYDDDLGDMNYRKAYTDHIKSKYEEVMNLR